MVYDPPFARQIVFAGVASYILHRFLGADKVWFTFFNHFPNS